MSVRARVYAFLAGFALLAGGGYFANQRYDFKGWPPSVRADQKKAEKKATDDDAVPVEVQAAERGPISAQIRSTANLRALRNVELKAQAEGVVRQVLAEEGDRVRQGDPLALLDDRQLKINLELAEQRLEQTKAQLESARILKEKNASQIESKKNELARNESALEAGLVSDTDVALLRSQLAELVHDERAQGAAVRENESRVEELTAEIESVRVQISHTRVEAPFSGRITERTVQLGQTVRAADTLFRLASFEPLLADVFLSEADSRLVQPGQSAEVSLDAAAAQLALGRVIRVSPVVDDSTGTVKATIELRSPDASFRPGSFVRVRIETDTRSDAVLISKRALIEEEGRVFVFIRDGEIARRKAIELGYQSGAVVEVRSGIEPGEQVVVAGQGALKDGAKTRVVTS